MAVIQGFKTVSHGFKVYATVNYMALAEEIAQRCRNEGKEAYKKLNDKKEWNVYIENTEFITIY